MDRDRRLTGTLRGQTDKPEAPSGFELNNPWKVGSIIWWERWQGADTYTVGNSVCLIHRVIQQYQTKCRKVRGKPHVYILKQEALGYQGSEELKGRHKTSILTALLCVIAIVQLWLRYVLVCMPGARCYIAISALFLFKVSNNVHAWHIA